MNKRITERMKIIVVKKKKKECNIYRKKIFSIAILTIKIGQVIENTLRIKTNNNFELKLGKMHGFWQLGLSIL